MRIPTADPIFTLMRCRFRRDRYAKAGDALPPHSHDFDHGVYVERGSARVCWFNPDHEAVLRADAGTAAIFRRRRVHSLIALEDETVVMTVLPAQTIGG